MATAWPSGRVGSFTHSAEPRQSEFFACKRGKQNTAGELALERREQARELQEARRAGSVVVRAGVNLADLGWRKRVMIAVTEMIVVRSQNDVFVGLAGKIGEDIVHSCVRAFDARSYR